MAEANWYVVHTYSGYENKAGDTANAINNWLKLGVADPRGSATNYIDLNLKTKYPWVEILNTYHCDEESAMKEILKIVDRY